MIAASSGDIGLAAKIAIGLAVLMLQGMIVYILDALFSGQLRLVLYPIYIIGYIILALISVAFAFGFYWRFLEAVAQTTQAADFLFLRSSRSCKQDRAALNSSKPR